MQKETTNYSGLEIAVIGMACQFPGSENIEAFWENLKAGNEGIVHLTKEELLEQGIGEDVIKSPGFVGVNGYLKNKEYFDNHFFHFTPHEAKVLDPQIRVFFQTAWNALEDAGINPEVYNGRIGIYAGGRDNPTWQAYTTISNDPTKVDSFTLGQYNNKEFLSTLLSYKFNLRGPAVFVATACSTSLVALHQAGRALLLGDADVCLAGGVSVAPSLTPGYFHKEGMIMSSDGKCRAFSEGSDGTVGGEGSGVVVLKRLKDALRDGDQIYALIKGSAINNDGKRKVGYSAPSIDGQVDCIRRAHAISKIDASGISYIEAHGTATKLGDPIEVQALNEVFGNHEGQICKIGSVKSNIGHTGTAAGIAGFIKTALSLKNQAIPPSLHVTNPNPEIPFSDGPIRVNTALSEWNTQPGTVRRAGVSSFGIGGTNAHVVLEEAPEKKPAPKDQSTVIMVSGMNLSAAIANKQALAEWLTAHPESSLMNVAYTMRKRKHFEYRIAVTADSIQNATSQLQTRKPIVGKVGHQVVFMCSGQGSQYSKMAFGLYREHALFREWIDKGLAIAADYSDAPFRALLFDEHSDQEQINELENSLPLMFIVEYAMAQLLIHQGIVPSKLIGHSSGEYVAACLSGIFSYQAGLRLVIQRSKLMQRAEEGQMLSVPLSEEELLPLLNTNLSLTAVNGPDLCVIGGTATAIDAFSYQLSGLGYDCKVLKATRAAHSYFMDPILEDFRTVLEQVTFHPPTIPVISNVTGIELTAEQAVSVEYWCDHLRKTVRFSKGIETLLRSEHHSFIEIGPGQTLCNFVRQQAPSRLIVQTIRHPKNPVDDQFFYLEVLGNLWENGFAIDFGTNESNDCSVISLPGYQFDRIKYPVIADMEAIKQLIGVQLNQEDTSDNLGYYTESWQQTTPIARQTGSTDRWIVCIASDNPFGRAVQEQLRSTSSNVYLVWRGTNTVQLSADEFSLNTASDNCFNELLQLVHSSLEGEGEVIYCAPEIGASNQETRFVSESDYFFDLTNCVKAMEEAQHKQQIRFTIVTQEAHTVSGNETVRPEHAMLYGAFKVLSQECMQLSMRYIDVLGSTESIPQLMAELNSFGSENEIALRWGKRWMRSLMKLPASTKTTLEPKQHGLALITGAPGGMARVLTEYLGTQHAMKIGLIGRSPLTAEWTEELNRLGIEYTFCQADMNDKEAIFAATQSITSKYGTTIDVLFHAAGIGDYAGLLLGRKKQESLDVLAPKTNGTKYLFEALKSCTIEQTVLCSSRAVEVAPVGQVAYVAGNEYLNAVAKSRPNTVSIGWEAWKEIGMAIKSTELAGKDANHLDDALTNAEALEALNVSIASNLPYVIVSRKNLHQLISEYKNRVQSVAEADTVVEIGVQSRSHLKSEFIAPENDLETQLQQLWSEFFGMENIGVEDDFFELGGDSLKLMRMHRTICSTFQIKFELVELFIHFKIRPLANFLIQSGLIEKTEETAKEIETIKF